MKIYIFYDFSSNFSFELCLGRHKTRQDKTYIEMGVSYNLILRYIILRIWAWKFHSIVENLIWYFFLLLSLFFHFSSKKDFVRKLDLESLSVQGDGIWLVIAFLFRSFRCAKKRKRFSTEKWWTLENCFFAIEILPFSFSWIFMIARPYQRKFVLDRAV